MFRLQNINSGVEQWMFSLLNLLEVPQVEALPFFHPTLHVKYGLSST